MTFSRQADICKRLEQVDLVEDSENTSTPFEAHLANIGHSTEHTAFSQQKYINSKKEVQDRWNRQVNFIHVLSLRGSIDHHHPQSTIQNRRLVRLDLIGPLGSESC